MRGAMSDGRSGISATAELAVREEHQAERLDRRAAFDVTDRVCKTLEAERARQDAERALRPPSALVGDASTELVPAAQWGLNVGDSIPPVRLSYTDTLANPETVAVDASEQRAWLATRANLLSPALDAAKTVGASNSIEKMLCHQLAAAHHAAMELLIKAQDSQVFGKLAPVEHVRMTNGAARLMDVFQAGCLALQKLQGKRRSAGRRAAPAAGPRLRWRKGCRCREATPQGQAGAGDAHRREVEEMSDLPHARRLGWLKNGNPPGDLSQVPRCGARTKGRGTPCHGPSMKNGRCRMHGGKSTGPRTPEGLERSRRANWKHGGCSRETRELLRENRRRWRELTALLARLPE